MAGREVSRLELDSVMADTLIAARNAMQGLGSVNSFLDRNPIDENGVDPLTVSTVPSSDTDPNSAPGKYGYTPEEAALIRKLFGQLASMKPVIDPIFEEARALTGLS